MFVCGGLRGTEAGLRQGGVLMMEGEENNLMITPKRIHLKAKNIK